MRCSRCGGFCIPVRYEMGWCVDGVPWGWSCVNCGEVVDAVILQNRQHHEQPNKSLARV